VSWSISHLTNGKISRLANPQIPQMADASGGISLYAGCRFNHKGAKMELTLKRYGISVKVLRQQVEEKTDRMVKQVYRRHSSEQRLDNQKEYLEASGSRYVSPMR
jgi:hypothetical protein